MNDDITPTRFGSSPQKQNHTLCVVCGKSLTGKQTKFCSAKCKSRDGNVKRQCYEAQKTRAVNRKLELVFKLGGKCSCCGYSKNLAALCFHHREGKDFALDARSLSNRNFESIKNEVSKCTLLCHNCHMEKHYPSLTLPCA